MVAIKLRDDYDASGLRKLAKKSKDADQTRRLLALSLIYEGRSRSEAARIGGVGLQTVRDWVLAFNAKGPEGLIDGKAPGKPPLLNKQVKAAIRKAIEDGPVPYVHGVVRWRLLDLIQWLSDEFGLSVSKQTLSREVRAMGFRKLSARPRHHAQNTEAVQAFKKTSEPVWRMLSRRKRPESPLRFGSKMKPALAKRTK